VGGGRGLPLPPCDQDLLGRPAHRVREGDGEAILILSVPTIRKKVERDKKLTEALSELGALDANIASDPDPVGSILNGFFAGVPTEAPSDAAEV